MIRSRLRSFASILGPLMIFGGCSVEAENPAPSSPKPSEGVPPTAPTTGETPTPPAPGPAPTTTPSCATNDAAFTAALSTVAPTATDPAIRTGDADHIFSAARTAPNGKLFVFFPGTGGRPDEYSYIVQLAAVAGYDAIGLSYTNEVSVNKTCQEEGGADTACQEKMRLEILTGEDRSTLTNIDTTNSVQNRLVKLLTHLAWTQYLSADGQPRWDLMTVAGHSQGGGHAGMLGHLHPMNRVMLFSSTEPAPWTKAKHETSADRFYAFVNTADPSATAMKASWQNFALPGDVVNVDGSPVPATAHRLETSVPPRSGSPRSKEHNEPIVDDATPLDTAGLPALRPVWCHLLGASGS